MMLFAPPSVLHDRLMRDRAMRKEAGYDKVVGYVPNFDEPIDCLNCVKKNKALFDKELKTGLKPIFNEQDYRDAGYLRAQAHYSHSVPQFLGSLEHIWKCPDCNHIHTFNEFTIQFYANSRHITEAYAKS